MLVHIAYSWLCVQVQTTTCRDIQMTNEIQPTRLTAPPVHLMYYRDYIHGHMVLIACTNNTTQHTSVVAN